MEAKKSESLSDWYSQVGFIDIIYIEQKSSNTIASHRKAFHGALVR